MCESEAEPLYFEAVVVSLVCRSLARLAGKTFRVQVQKKLTNVQNN